jgi:hypothetical protein
MGSFENIQHKEIRNLTAELDAVLRQLVKSGWNRTQVLGFVTELLDEPAGTRSGEPDAKKED